MSEYSPSAPDYEHYSSEFANPQESLVYDLHDHAAHGEVGHVCSAECQHTQEESNKFADDLFEKVTHDHSHDHAAHGEVGHYGIDNNQGEGITEAQESPTTHDNRAATPLQEDAPQPNSTVVAQESPRDPAPEQQKPPAELTAKDDGEQTPPQVAQATLTRDDSSVSSEHVAEPPDQTEKLDIAQLEQKLPTFQLPDSELSNPLSLPEATRDLTDNNATDLATSFEDLEVEPIEEPLAESTIPLSELNDILYGNLFDETLSDPDATEQVADATLVDPAMQNTLAEFAQTEEYATLREQAFFESLGDDVVNLEQYALDEPVRDMMSDIDHTLSDDTEGEVSQHALDIIDTLLNAEASNYADLAEREPLTHAELRRSIVELAKTLNTSPEMLLALMEIEDSNDDLDTQEIELSDLQYKILIALKQSISIEDSSEFSLASSLVSQTTSSDTVFQTLSKLALRAFSTHTLHANTTTAAS